jgi:hypothetical protein
LGLDPRERLTQHVRLGAGDALREPRERGIPVARLLEGGQHQFRYISLAGRGRPVPPCAAVPFPAREPLLGQPVEHRHDGGVGQALRKPVADLSDRQR